MHLFSLTSRWPVFYRPFLLVCLLLGLSLLPALAQTTRYVTTTGTGPASAATSWASSTTDLQGAINASASGDAVWVATGTYKPGGNANTVRTVSFAMKAGVAIYGGFAGTENLLTDRPAINPTIDQPSSSTLSGNIGTPGTVADNSYHVINNPEGLTSTAILDGFVITGGQADGGTTDQKTGAGMLNNGSGSGKVCSPTIRNCLFQSNATTPAGGGNGGGIRNNGSSGGNSNPTITNCAFLNNSAYVGGAIIDDATSGTASPVITNCLFQSNSVAYGGGAIFNNAFNGNASPTLTNCSFLNNTAVNGGALFNDGRPNATSVSAPHLTNCSFQGNTASSQGGAMYTNNTGGATLVITNCVFFGNSATSGFGPAPTATYSLFSQSVSGTGNINNVSVNPFVSTTSTVLRTGSPAINMGSNAAYTAAGGPATDLAGNTRTTGTSIDMGAYEFQPLLPVTLRYFNGRMTESGALLAWQTAREDNNGYFQIERSRDAVGFESIATVPTQAVDGVSVTPLAYSYLDAQPLPGINYYRLTQTDRDGTRTQAGNVVALSREGQQPVLFPNPVSASGEASIEPAISHMGYTVSDVLGLIVQRQDAPGVLSRVSLAGLPAGVYVLRVQTDAGGVKTWRVLR
jgi:hypothetical protein